LKVALARKVLMNRGHVEAVKFVPRPLSKGLGRGIGLNVPVALKPLVVVVAATVDEADVDLSDVGEGGGGELEKGSPFCRFLRSASSADSRLQKSPNGGGRGSTMIVPDSARAWRSDWGSSIGDGYNG
jgi:hypothetical protein